MVIAMNLLHKTRGSAPINSKQLIFVHAAEPDYADRDRVIKMILESENGGDYAVLYADEGAFRSISVRRSFRVSICMCRLSQRII